MSLYAEAEQLPSRCATSAADKTIGRESETALRCAGLRCCRACRAGGGNATRAAMPCTTESTTGFATPLIPAPGDTARPDFLASEEASDIGELIWRAIVDSNHWPSASELGIGAVPNRPSTSRIVSLRTVTTRGSNSRGRSGMQKYAQSAPRLPHDRHRPLFPLQVSAAAPQKRFPHRLGQKGQKGRKPRTNGFDPFKRLCSRSCSRPPKWRSTSASAAQRSTASPRPGSSPTFAWAR